MLSKQEIGYLYRKFFKFKSSLSRGDKQPTVPKKEVSRKLP